MISRVALQQMMARMSLASIFFIMGLGFGGVLISLTMFSTVFAWSIISILNGFFFNFTFTLINTMAMKNVPLSDKTAANAFLFVCLDFGFFLGGIIWGQVGDAFSLSSIFIFGAILILITQTISALIIWKKNIQF